jgi:hypothetical protein
VRDSLKIVQKELRRDPLTVATLLRLYGIYGVILVTMALDELMERDEDFIRRNSCGNTTRPYRPRPSIRHQA